MARTPKVVEDRSEQIIDAALRVFSRKGFTKATNKDIAREAGITPGLIYYYFENKEALFRALVESRSPLRLLSSLPEQARDMPVEPFMRFLLGQILAFVEGEQFVGLIRVMLPEIIHSDDPYLSQTVTDIFGRVVEIVSAYFAAKVRSGELRPLDAALTAQVLVGSVIGFVLRRQLIRDQLVLALTQEQIVDAIMETMLQGILPR
ncbi:MAG TPA: TetR/AcrR family transcriptional regulator [Ktedonobacteraceae bacterium]|nr:TetR/AcrR family transcriptional regulator [Ktedonobacteraceae bacterium]